MRILVVGSGGREHALVWKIAQSPQVREIYCAPGNPGIAETAECVDIAPDDFDALRVFVQNKNIDLTVIGPEAPLVDGIADFFAESGLAVLGPNRKAAQLEGSKVYAKEFMARHGIPTAAFSVFDRYEEAVSFIEESAYPLVVKADGLAAGKGVTVADCPEEALQALQKIMQEKQFGAAGERVVIEECLEGEEVSVMALTDGIDYLLLPEAQDHKAIYEGDRGPNTGGMGAYSPAPVFNSELQYIVNEKVFSPLITGLQEDGLSYRGVIYAGLIITPEGPKVLEFNVRFGDPEAQVILPRIASDIVPLFKTAAMGRPGDLGGMTVESLPDYCACVVLASGGYPGKYARGKAIQGLDTFNACTNPLVFHAGTAREKGTIVTNGGRVIGVTGWDKTLEDALDRIYESIAALDFEGVYYRRDIGYKALPYFQNKKN